MAFVHCFVTVCFVYLARQFGQLLVSPFFTVFVQFRHSSVYYDSYSHSRAVVPLT